MERSGGRSAGNAARWALGSVIVGVVAAAAVVLTSVAPAEPGVTAADVVDVAPVAPAPLAAASPVTAAPATTPSTPTTTNARATASEERPRTTRTPARSSAGCGPRAVSAGEFDASCSEYQGYLDPGSSAGRGPTSGELQTQYGCDQGYIPEDECD